MPGIRTAASICFTLASFTPALAQQQPAEPKILEVSNSETGVTSWRRVETRTTAGGTTVASAAVQVRDADGRWATQTETTTQTVVTASGTTTITEDSYGYPMPRTRILLERSQSEQVQLPDGRMQTISRTWTGDVNGRLDPQSQTVEERRSGAGESETNTRFFMRDINGRLSEAAQATHTETQLPAGASRLDTSLSHRDLNGRWQTVEIRHAEVSDKTAAQGVEEEIVSRPDINGAVGISERSLTRRSQVDGREEAVIERYAPRDPAAAQRSLNRMDLTERTRISTTTATDGTRETVEEVEARSPVAAGDPLRVRRRVITTVRPLGGDRSMVERQIFDLDANGRFVLTATEHREGSAP